MREIKKKGGRFPSLTGRRRRRTASDEHVKGGGELLPGNEILNRNWATAKEGFVKKIVWFDESCQSRT